MGQRGPATLQDQVVACLRAEIQEHGVLLGIFSAQQKAIMQRESDRVMIFVDDVQRQVDLVQKVRSRRDMLMSQMVPFYEDHSVVGAREALSASYAAPAACFSGRVAANL